MRNLKNMRNKEIVEELKARGVAEEQYTEADGKKWVSRKTLIDLYMKPVYEARDLAKDTLGKEFSKAVSFWKQLKCIDSMTEYDYPEMVTSWNVLKNLVNVDPSQGAFDLLKTAEALRDIFCPTTFLGNYSQEELASFVESSIAQFQLSAFTERLVKDSTDIIKMSMDNCQFTAENGVIFDSSEAAHLTGKKIDFDQKNTIMRVVESSEDGISRILQEMGKDSLTIFLGQQGRNEDEQKRFDAQKRKIFMEGITDISTGKHYMWAFQNPSSCRKANFMFVEANDWEEVKGLWCAVTGAKDYDELTEMLLKGKVVMSKTIARISTRGSNSFNLSKISPKWAEKISHARIDYTGDVKMKINRPYREQLQGGLLGDVQNGERTVTPGDGQMIGSFDFHALIAVGMRIISENEYTDFKVLWASVGKDISKVKIGSRLYKLIRKIPSVFQIRHGSKKGICVRYNLEAIEQTKDIDAIVPESVRKFVDGDWSTFPLEICNYLKKKKEWVALNPQFIGALQYENPNALNDIVKYWLDYAEASLDDPAKAQQFHGIIKSSDDEDNDTVASNLVAAMRTSSDLINESQICNWRKDQYRKFLKDMQIGRILVNGVYSYMVCDPAFLVAQTYGIDVPHLQSDEYYFNGKSNCECGLFRSPLIHPSEAQKVSLCDKDNYWYYQDVIIFNGYDGTWDRMGGADFDGDICAIIPDDTEFGRIICDGIKDYGYDIVIPSITAQKVEFTQENLINHLVKTAHPDRTGKITNEAMTCLDIANHLRGMLYFCKTFYKCETITFIHPNEFGESLGREYTGATRMNSNGTKTLCTKGFVTAVMDREEGIKFTDIAVLGEKTFDEVEKIAEYYEDLAGSGKVCVGTEIDGAKTGVYAEGEDGTRYPKELQMKFCAHHSITRKESLGRPISIGHKLNKYFSMSALGRIHDLVGDWDNEGTNAYKIAERLSSGTDKMFLLHSLLTDDERKVLNMRWNMSDGSVQGLVDMLKARKKIYNTDIRGLIMNTSDSEQACALRTRKERELQELYTLCQAINVPVEVCAVAAYIATYDKDSKQNDALTYGWILFDELLSVFSRGNKKFELFRLPSNVESTRIEAGYLYINDNKYMPINAEDCDCIPVQIINGRNYGLIRKIVKRVEDQKGVDVVYNSTIYTIGAFGFKYHIENGTPAAWKQIVADNGFVCDITMDDTNRAVISVNGKSIAALMRTTNFELMGKRIKFVNCQSTIKETAGAITGLQCVIIGEAQ